MPRLLITSISDEKIWLQEASIFWLMPLQSKKQDSIQEACYLHKASSLQSEVVWREKVRDTIAQQELCKTSSVQLQKRLKMTTSTKMWNSLTRAKRWLKSDMWQLRHLPLMRRQCRKKKSSMIPSGKKKCELNTSTEFLISWSRS